MDSGWMDKLSNEATDPDDPLESFYCPYTNASECGLLTKGWQPQELCHDLECEQLRFVQQRPRRRRKAA